MAMLDQTGAIERLRFFNGQRLVAGDLQGIEAFNREMRWLHNRSLHQPGIGNGFAVSGKKGDRQVKIGPGYALDASGREIVLIKEHEEPVPPIAGEIGGGSVFFDLVVSYPADADLEEAETREGICLPRGVVRLREEPLFCWVRLTLNELTGELTAVDHSLGAQVREGQRIRLARIEVENCKLKHDLSTAQRRNARPPKQPRIVCDSVDVAWDYWAIPDGEEAIIIGLIAEISTAAGCFVNTPCYSARIDGTRPFIAQDSSGELRSSRLFFDGPVYVQGPERDRFTAAVPVLPFPEKAHAPELRAWARENWRVVWLAVEE